MIRTIRFGQVESSQDSQIFQVVLAVIAYGFAGCRRGQEWGESRCCRSGDQVLLPGGDRGWHLRPQDYVPLGLSCRRLHAPDGQDPLALIEGAGILGDLPGLSNQQFLGMPYCGKWII